MTEEEKITCYHTVAETFHCDFRHQLCLGHLGNSMLNAADMHSTARGFGMTRLQPEGKTWVLSRLAIELTDLPQEHQPYTIETWVEGAMKYFTRRNWAITSPDRQHVYGYGRSIWAMIDTTTRSPADILAVDNGRIADYLLPERQCDMDDVSRVRTPAMTEYTEFQVKYSDIDVNGHLNSMKYVDHVLDTFTLQHYRTTELRRLEIAYVAEAHCGDTIRVYHAHDGEQHYFRLARLEAEGSETELCRLKIQFNQL